MLYVSSIFSSNKHAEMLFVVLSRAHVISNANNATFFESGVDPCNCFTCSCPPCESVWFHLVVAHNCVFLLAGKK